jgi:FolB domain-containing protein
MSMARSLTSTEAVVPLADSTNLTSPCHLRVFGIEVACFLGYYDHEQLAPRSIIVDVEFVIQLNREEVLHDELLNTLNYEKIASEVKRVANSQRFKLVETLCAQLLLAIGQLKGVSDLKVAVTKPNPIESVRGVRIEMQSKHYL